MTVMVMLALAVRIVCYRKSKISLPQHLVIDFVRVVEAFITQVGDFEDGANGYYAVLNNPLEVAKTVVYATQTTMGDAVMVCLLV